MQYPAVIDREGKYVLAEFPDCPGCQTFVEFGEDIMPMAREAVEGWLEVHLDLNELPPRPSPLTRFRGDVRGVPIHPLIAIRLELRWARAEASLTQAQLAEKVGMSQQQLARLESGDSNPTVKTISRVAEALGRQFVMSLERPARLIESRKHSRAKPPTQRVERNVRTS
jgi:DNA-binding XRE family transcriptional regulator/predicted RNase H-like HicB family nuclease